MFKWSFSSRKPPVRLCLPTARLTSGLWKVGGRWWLQFILNRPLRHHLSSFFILLRSVLSRSSLFLRRPVWRCTDNVTHHSRLHANLARGRLKSIFAPLIWFNLNIELRDTIKIIMWHLYFKCLRLLCFSFDMYIKYVFETWIVIFFSPFISGSGSTLQAASRLQ